MENKIILIEDDEEIRGMITDYLSGEFEVLSFNDGTTAIRTNISYDEYSLALIDLMLPDMSGMEIIKSIRRVTNIPIIIITAKDNDTDKSLGLNLGADDYVVKPFSLIELAARIKATNKCRASVKRRCPSHDNGCQHHNKGKHPLDDPKHGDYFPFPHNDDRLLHFFRLFVSAEQQHKTKSEKNQQQHNASPYTDHIKRLIPIGNKNQWE